MATFIKILSFAILPVITMLTGGIIAIVRKINGNLRSLILHFAAGVVFSVVAVEIIPDVIRNHNPVMATVGFALGFISMIGIKKIADMPAAYLEKDDLSGKIPWGLLSGIGVDIVIDGLLLGIGFAAGAKEGKLLAFALAVELLSLGMATVTELKSASLTKNRILIILATISSLFFISALLGGTLLQHLSHDMLELVLSFGVSALLFLVTEELLIEAHEEKETVWHTSAFFFGFLLFLIFGMII